MAPIWDDVTTLCGGDLPISPDIIYGGFPCQDISVAGLGAGLEGERSGLFFEISRLVCEIQPAFVFLENVPAIRTRGGERVVKELATLGYDCRWDYLSAFDMGAPHRRERWFLLAANTKRVKLRIKQRRGWGSHRERQAELRDDGQKQFMENANCRWPRSQLQKVSRKNGSKNRPEIERQNAAHQFIDAGWWSAESCVDRVAHGVPLRTHRLRGLGNAVVPAQAAEAFRRLMGFGA
jgi:DNA (cytosine-5)-methyltransferase 1